MNLLPDKQTFIKISSRNISLLITVTCTKISKDNVLYGIIVPRSYWHINLLFSSFSNFSQIDNTLFYNQNNAVYSLQQRNTVDFGLWSWFSSFERKGSGWKPYTQLPGNIAGSLVFVAVPKTRTFAQSLASRSHNSEPTKNIWNERRSTLQCWSTRYRHEEIRTIRYRRHWIHSGSSCSGYGQCLSTSNWYPVFPSIVDDFQMEEGSTTANPKIVGDEEYKENSAPTTSTTPESKRATEPPRLLRSRPFWTRLEFVPDSVYRTLFH